MFFINQLIKNSIKQKSHNWYQAREHRITATKVATILYQNNYELPNDLLKKTTQEIKNKKKRKYLKPISNESALWGIKYENVAKKIYEYKYNRKIYDIGFITHKEYNWIGASPDGISDDPLLLEIKCPYTRIINENEIPRNYWIQCQIQMEVCDIPICHYYECKFKEYNSKKEYLEDNIEYPYKGILKYKNKYYYWKLEKDLLHIINRDKIWFKNNLKILQDFQKVQENLVKDSLNQKNKKRKLSSITIDEYNSKKKIKKSDTNLIVTRSKTQNMLFDNRVDWLSSNNLFNYFNNDLLCDWLDYHGDKYKDYITYDLFTDYLQKKNKIFKNNIIKNIKNKFPTKSITICNYPNEIYSYYRYKYTLECINKNIPIIFNALLFNNKDRQYCVIDILIRNDYINKIWNNCKYISKTKKWNYNIISINSSKFDIDKEFHFIKNIKSQQTIFYETIFNYKLCLDNNIIIDNIYVCCLESNYKIKDEKYTNYCFEYLPHINKNQIKNYLKKINSGFEWIEFVKKDGKNWNLEDLNRIELLPNMNIKNTKWHSLKKYISEKYDIVSNLWYVGYKDQVNFYKKNITSWKDKKFNVSDLKISDEKKILLKSIISIQDDNEIIKGDFNNINKKNENDFEFFIDFETSENINELNTTYPKMKYNNYIYLIGIGWIQNKKWNYKYFISDNLSLESEKKLVNEWILFIQNKILINNKKNIILYHWGHAEKNLINSYIEKHNILEKELHILNSLNWKDLCLITKKNNIRIKGSLNYGLKNIANSLYKNNLIQTKWPDDNIDGMHALIEGYNANNLVSDTVKMEDNLKNIIPYNEVDCKVLFEIIELYRQYKTNFIK